MRVSRYISAVESGGPAFTSLSRTTARTPKPSGPFHWTASVGFESGTLVEERLRSVHDGHAQCGLNPDAERTTLVAGAEAVGLRRPEGARLNLGEAPRIG
jgi:hypothetical protein